MAWAGSLGIAAARVAGTSEPVRPSCPAWEGGRGKFLGEGVREGGGHGATRPAGTQACTLRCILRPAEWQGGGGGVRERKEEGEEETARIGRVG